MTSVSLPRESNQNMKIYAFAAALALGVFVSAPVCADDATTATPPKADAAARAAKSAECLKDADAKGLRLKDRKKFLRECKRGN